MIQELNEIATQLDLQTDLIDEIKNIQLDLRQDFGVIFDAIVEGNGLLDDIKNSIAESNSLQSESNVIENASPIQLNSPGEPGIDNAGTNDGGEPFSRISNLLNRLSFPLPGGARIFGLGDLISDEQKKSFSGFEKANPTLTKFALGAGAAATAAFAVSRAFNSLSKELGTTPGEAARIYSAAVGSSITTALTTGRILTPSDITQIQAAFAQEFGGILTTEAATQLAVAANDLGVTTDQLIALERTLQGTGRESRSTINQFKQLGINGRVAAQELNKNATAIARAGSQFNSFIVQGIANAKRLGLEFSQIEKTLTGFATDFEGTIESFANVRAVIPGLATDFSQLFSTALYGSTDDFIEQIRGSLLGAGIGDISQLNRLQVAELEKATGFTGDQLNRILNNQDVNADTQITLDTTRNSLLSRILAVSGAILGATILPGVLGKIIGAVVGGSLGFGFGKYLESQQNASVDDAIIQNGQIITTDPADTLIATKTPEELGTQQVSVNMEKLESKMDKLIMNAEQQLNVFKNGMFVEMRDLDKAMIRQQESAIRNY
jgi:hypothetical protein